MRGSHYTLVWKASILICLLSCSVESERWPVRVYIQNVPIISDITLEEVEAITLVEQSIAVYLGITPPSYKGIFFVRDPNQPLPEYCKGPGCNPRCADKWKDYPKVNEVKESHPGIGYGGMTGVHIYISRIGPYLNYDALIDLLVHERMHEVTKLGDGPEHMRITREVKEILYKKLEEEES